MSIRQKKYNRLRSLCAKCVACSLHENRTRTVFGVGNLNADLMFVGEGPGVEEDKTGKPFVGRAGKLLTRIIESMGLTRGDVYISNIVKCHSVRREGVKKINCPPTEEEYDECFGRFLIGEIALVRPQVIVTLGRSATNCVLDKEVAIGKIRGKWQNGDGAVKRIVGPLAVMPTFHPAFLLRKGHKEKALFWQDMKKVMRRLSYGAW